MGKHIREIGIILKFCFSRIARFCFVGFVYSGQGYGSLTAQLTLVPGTGRYGSVTELRQGVGIVWDWHRTLRTSTRALLKGCARTQGIVAQAYRSHRRSTYR